MSAAWSALLDWVFDRCWNLAERFGPALFEWLTHNEAA